MRLALDKRKLFSGEKQSLLLLTVIASFLALIPTFWVAWISNSVSLRADLFRCSAEFIAIFVSFLVVKKSSSPQAAAFNFGLGKLEYIASLCVAAVLLISFAIAVFNGINRFLNPQALSNVFWGILFTAISIFGNLYVWLRSKKYLLIEYSPVIESQISLFRAKTILCLVVLLALLLGTIFQNFWWSSFCDPVGSLVVAAFLLYSAFVTLSSSVNGLLDRTLEEALQLEIMSVLLKNESLYRTFHGVRSRRAGVKIFVQIFLGYDPTSSLANVLAANQIIIKDVQQAIDNSEVLIIPVAEGFES